MSQPPDDPFYNGPTENTAWPPQWPGQGQNKPQQASAPNQRPAYPPNQGPISMPGFSPQAPNQGPGSMPGFSPQAPNQGPISMPPGFSPQAPNQGPISMPPGFSPQAPNQGPNSMPGFSPQAPGQGLPQRGPAPNYPGQPPFWQGGFAPSQPPGVIPGQEATIVGTFSSPAGQQQNFPPQQQQFPQYGTPPADPNQIQPPNPPRKSRKGLLIISIVLVVILIVGGASAFLVLHSKNKTGANGTPTAQGTPTKTGQKATPVPTQNQSPTTGNVGTLGQPIQAGANWVATMTHVDETTASAIPPGAGQTYLEISISLKNVSATTLPVSSAVQFSLVDSKGKAYLSIAAVGDTNVHQPLDANIGSGQTLNGQIPYKVPQSMHDFVLTFEYDLIQGSNASIMWRIHV